ncbi:MAG: hypothetical protein H5U19_01370 [Rhodobacteraceae bacterium]|nr:hypothetical protein [Paracoccaceae bacterium]
MAWLAVPTGVQAGPDDLTMDLATARVFARAAIAEGQGELARSVALGLLQADPDDFFAYAILSAAESLRNRPDAARAAGQRAYRLASTDAERYEASILTARALADDQSYTLAQLWLRRAVQDAPDEVARAGAERQFLRVRRVNPLSVSLSFGITPTSNVNNGSSKDRIEVFGLPFQLSGASQELSGLEISGGASLRYRLAQTQDSATEAGALLFGRTFRLSDSARRKAPDAKGSDFAFQAVELSLTHRFRTGADRPVYSVGGTLGRNWFGGDALTNYARLSLGRTVSLAQSTAFDLDLTGEARDRLDNSDRSSTRFEIRAGITHAFASGDRGGGYLGLRREISDSEDTDHAGVLAGLRYLRGSPVAGLRLSAQAEVEWREYGVTALAPGGREDFSATLGVTATFERVQYYGFSPSLELRARQVTSDVALFESREIGLRLGLVSAF